MKLVFFLERPLCLATDASDQAPSSSICQTRGTGMGNGLGHNAKDFLSYFMETISPSEQNCFAIKRGLLGVVSAVKKSDDLL
jgi:RNase H-like domain found in reverse transcriptase